MAFKPLHDRVLVKRIQSDEKTKGGLIIPDTAKEKPAEGEVVAVGADNPLSYLLCFLAVAFATLNVVGGYVVTDRMLQMFRRKPATPKAEKVEEVED